MIGLPVGIDTALTIAQPWATLVVEGPRRIVNLARPPPPALLGKRIAIYAADVPDLEACAHAIEFLDAMGIPEIKRNAWRTRTVRGAIMGTAVMAGVFTESQDRWFTGPFGIWLTHGEPLEEAVKIEGRVGFWRITK
jgi:hypothetical protein